MVPLLLLLLMVLLYCWSRRLQLSLFSLTPNLSGFPNDAETDTLEKKERDPQVVQVPLFMPLGKKYS